VAVKTAVSAALRDRDLLPGCLFIVMTVSFRAGEGRWLLAFVELILFPALIVRLDWLNKRRGAR
jgi:hypothetical protein